MPQLYDTTIRLLSQEPLAGRVPTGEVLRVAEILDGAGFACLEVSGGGVFDAAVRNEVLQIVFWSILFAVILAVFGALGRLSSNPYFNRAASLYVSLVRGTPLIVQILFIFLALPAAGIVVPPLPTGIIALAFNYGAYLTEVFRAGIQAVPGGQVEAARALGLPESIVMRKVILPQAIRIVTPAVGNDFIAMTKDSALVSIVGVQELLWRAQAAGRPTGQSFQTIIVAALMYWCLTLVLSYFQARLEKRMAAGDRNR